MLAGVEALRNTALGNTSVDGADFELLRFRHEVLLIDRFGPNREKPASRSQRLVCQSRHERAHNVRHFLDEYRVALRLWSETKALYSEDSAEFAQAAGSLTKLEHDLMRWEVQALATTL